MHQSPILGTRAAKPNKKCPPPPAAPSHIINPAQDEASPKAQVTLCQGFISRVQLASLLEEPQQSVAVRVHPAQVDYQNYNCDLQSKPCQQSQDAQTMAKLFLQGYCSNAFLIKLSVVRQEHSVL